MEKKTNIQLTLTEQEARLVGLACEFYARIRMGQFLHIIWTCADIWPIDREAAEDAWLAFRKQIYPDLHGIGHSYGIGNFKDADDAFDVYQVIRHAQGDPRRPFTYSKTLPKCEKAPGTTSLLLTLTEDEANITKRACEFYARVRMGQFGEIVFYCASKHCPEDPQAAEEAWLALRKFIYPDLHGAGHSYGYGKFQDADKAFDIYEALRYALGGPLPFHYQNLPKCEKVED